MVGHFLAQIDDDRVKAVAQHLRDAVDLSRSKAGDTKDFTTVLGEFKRFLANMQVGVPYVVPGGWEGKLTRNAILYIAEKSTDDTYSLTICNRGPGSEYHPSRPDQFKVKVQSCPTIEGIPASRFLDMSFWSMVFALWLKSPPSEYHRVETLYDVLLPWLADSVLPTGFRVDASPHFSTATRNNTGFAKNVVEAAKFLMRKQGIAPAAIKRIMFDLRWDIAKLLHKDLLVVQNPTLPFQDVATEVIQILSGITFIDSVHGTHNLSAYAAASIVGLYFSSSTCGACKSFSSKLNELTQRVGAVRFPIIVVPLDGTDEEFADHLNSLPPSWHCIPVTEVDARKKLVRLFRVSAIPTLILTDATATVKTPLGVNVVLADQNGEFFPWLPPFELPIERLNDTESTCLSFAIKQTGLAALKQSAAGRLSTDELVAVQSLLASIEETAKLLRQVQSANSVADWTLTKQVPVLPFEHLEHFQTTDVDGYAGNVAEATVPVLTSMLDIPQEVTSLVQVATALQQYEQVCQGLMHRAGDGSSSSRVALHYEVIHVITTLFVEILPVPHPSNSDLWRGEITKGTQLDCLTRVHSLMLTFGVVWQSIDHPSRSMDATRTLASVCALAIYDVLLRNVAVDSPLEVSLIVAEGYVLAHSFCQNSRSLVNMTRAMELVQPSFSVVRGRVLAYFAHQHNATPIFDFRMPDEKVEVKKYSATITFLRKLMEMYQYPLIDINDENPPSEMEALVDWLTSEGTPLAQHHPEFALTRDLVTIVKFLATMETQEEELMRRRTGLRQWQMWSLTFDENTRFRRRPGGYGGGKLKWEVSGFRGNDQDIADIEVSGFNGRKLYFGEGPVVISPTALPALLHTSSSVLTEDDILHTNTLPQFQGTLSMEESEYLLCYLTVPYTRIPLVLNFFSSRDRVMYLFNTSLQSLLRAVLFEGSDWVYRDPTETSTQADVITHVPLRKSTLALQEDALEQAMDARVHHQKASDHLGTMNGLLLNELSHSPDATLQPILAMLKAITELGDASVHSSDASFLLFMIHLGVDVVRYVSFAAVEYASAAVQPVLRQLRAELVAQIQDFGMSTLEKWRVEAEEANDLRTSCVIHSYIAFIHMNVQVDEYTVENIAQLMGSVSYVRNWHCFGMRVTVDDEDGKLSSEERLLRWLQAHGIDTKNVALSSLEKYLTDRPLFLKVGMDIIQAPNILKKSSDQAARSPPGSVLENEIFELLQAKRRSIVAFISKLPANEVNRLLNTMLNIALRTPSAQTSHTWHVESGQAAVGRYVCAQAEMKVDFESGEILWRNDELKPVPDSMIQFSDYRHQFGQEALHCGLIARQTHRLWIHIIGTKFELMEWDEPTEDQGIGTPQKYIRQAPTSTGSKMYWECPACTCANFNGDQPNARCEVCQSPKDAPAPFSQDAPAAETPGGFIVHNVTYNRIVNPYSKEDHPEESEVWAVVLVRRILMALFPENHPTKKLPCMFFLPETVLASHATQVKLIGWHENNPPNSDFQSTFKELVVYRTYGMVHLFAWVSHGRRLCRKLIFTSNARLSLHGFVPTVEGQGQIDASVQFAAGDFMELQPAGGSLVIIRRTRGMETYVPPRLLQGLVHSAFLESFKFWLGQDNVIRGEPLDLHSQWFRYHLEITLEPHVMILRKASPEGFDVDTTVAVTTPSSPPPAPVTPAVPPVPVNDDDVVQLMALGFSYAGCVLALRECRNDKENAAQWLLDENNQVKLIDAEATIMLADAVVEESAVRASVKEVKSVQNTLTDGDLILINPLNVPSTDSTVACLCKVLSRVEDLSHVLIWTKDLDHENLASIESIELPRLKLRLEPRVGSDDGIILLYLADQPDWFVCLDVPSSLNALKLPKDCLVFATSRDELRVLVPNHDLYRPMMHGEPFSTTIVPNRASAGWQHVMETRYYLYPVHTSRRFLSSPSLSATFYLILLHLMARQYNEAAQYIRTSHIDVEFTDEEAWIFNQVAKTLDDRHPDACACRVLLNLAVQYSTNKCPWCVSDELHTVETSVAHVQSDCRLTLEEESDALRRSANMSSLLQARLAICQMPTLGTVVSLKPARLKVGGQPWIKLNMLSTTFLKDHASGLSNVRYKAPAESLVDEECLKLVWDHMVVADEASGANRGLGCLFLYQCFQRRVRLLLFGEDHTRSLAELLSRLLHLKLARWGKEVVDDGEEEAVVPVAIAQLSAVLANPSHEWPALPTDASSVMQLERGINLYSKAMKDSMLKHFFDLTQAEMETVLHTKQDIPYLRQQLSLAHKCVKETTVTVVESPFALRLAPTNSSCNMRVISCDLNPVEPLKFLDATRYVVHTPREKQSASTLPFNLSHHPSAQSVVAKDLLQRLAEDVKNHADAINSTQEVFFSGIVRGNFDFTKARTQLAQLVSECTVQRTKDKAQLEANIQKLESRINNVQMFATDSAEAKLAKSRFLLSRQAHQIEPADLNYIIATLSSTAMAGDLQQKNAFFSSTDLPAVLRLVQDVLFGCNRINQLNRLIQSADNLKRLTYSVHVPHERLLHASQDIAHQLIATRYYIREHKFDPRYLVFEYVFELMLRSRQVEMVDSFMRSLGNGSSRVQQMIMGAGKTTVVGPLLTYMLADRTVLITHVMPTALLEQSRAVLRSRFSNAILAKRIFTLSFDRSVDDSPELVVNLATKLIRACRQGDVICASPEAIKSLFLKFVELLHSVDESTFDADFDLHDVSKTGQRIRKLLTARSDMADELHRILRLWQKGILIMDEVDVLLHPLRSELNFPIGNKFPIDLAANRWELPLFLLDTIFSNANAALNDALTYGYSIHALQRFPHLVLLDQGFYHATLRPLLTELLYTNWLLPHLKMGKNNLTKVEITSYIESESLKSFDIVDSLSEHGVKLLNLSRDWIRSLLPHCLSKINRVSYGLLRHHHMQQTHTPSRLLLAVPFVGKDVPSRSSEFAHPDVLIGLTILAYRYEGIRRSDAKTIVSQLKHDFSRQLGPRDERPACVLFRSWVVEGLETTKSIHGVLPLPLFQLNDSSQVTRLLQLIQFLPSVVHYYVRQHVFPACMNFQKLKVSACGHELGSNSLFARRVGFSGTPSNLLPLDLGTCHYEPQSDGNIFSVLTSPQVTTIERKLNWTATTLLHDIATSDPPFHALIDTGALITGMDNEQVARFLLSHLPMSMEGVVYLDTSDRQMILLRDHNAALPLIQCGLSPEKRFTFYDQVHTTGMDIKQGINARAVLTLGKDMTFRDYAQGAYRMRGIGAGQTIHLYLIPEVENRIRQELEVVDAKTLDDFRLHVPAWLLVNSMKMESIQLVQLSLQELHNIWRTRAVEALLLDVDANKTRHTSGQRLLRFHQTQALRPCVDAFRVEGSYTIAAQVPVPRAITNTIEELTSLHASLLETTDYDRVAQVTARVATLMDMSSDMHLNAEVVHENEAEAEEEAEEEAEQEEQKMSAYLRDDEHPVPWSVDSLLQNPSQADWSTGSHAFYPLSLFQAQSACRAIAFPGTMLVSDNYYRRRWIGLGERRLKNIGFLMEWHPNAIQLHLKERIGVHFVRLVGTGLGPTDAAAQAIHLASQDPIENVSEGYVVAMSLAEGETVRRMLHCAHPVFNSSRVQLHMSDGALMESSRAGPSLENLAQVLQSFRFFNNEMYYTPRQLTALLGGLSAVPLHRRHEFFQSTLRLRRRERQLWGDTPLAKAFTKEDEWHLLSARAKMEQFQRGIKAKKIGLVAAWHRFDINNHGRLSNDELLRCFESFQLGFSPGDLNEIIGLLDGQHDGVTIAKLAHAFDVDLLVEAKEVESAADRAMPWLCAVCTFKNEGDVTSCSMCSEPRDHAKQVREVVQTWQCENCTFINPISETTCAVCEIGVSGRREVPKGMWVCDPDQGGCTFFNPNTSFYCDVCNRARPDLSTHRF
ncbi:hypothetical protein DYB32_002374 [Aphanomyces invadans]|uniref:ubiquitinyl hydrolase 1 n=1 Tax=Aphanomyces invadans TaxID=157072 RepID=A0A3R7ACR3_9STRA|nr:hypothetical protein DYB32_002374 [Aphanomyces invadans]